MKYNTKKILVSLFILLGIILTIIIISYFKIAGSVFIALVILLITFGIYAYIYDCVSDYYDNKREQKLKIFK